MIKDRVISEEHPMTFEDHVYGVLVDVGKMLISKNKAYGNAALGPLRIFSKADSTDGILLRIDDKLNRIKNVGITPETEDSVMDLIGYLVLLKISQENGKPEPPATQKENNSIPVSNQKGGTIRDYTATSRPEDWVTTTTVNGVNIAGPSESGKPF